MMMIKGVNHLVEFFIGIIALVLAIITVKKGEAGTNSPPENLLCIYLYVDKFTWQLYILTNAKFCWQNIAKRETK